MPGDQISHPSNISFQNTPWVFFEREKVLLGRFIPKFVNGAPYLHSDSKYRYIIAEQGSSS